ncbi:hypothetical protein SAMN02745126_00998 [Enhydrobacter aerosaccus]|uniref:Methyltransferase domain-containing protein n=1 Tax=Enhydrobacter aerosaccus TaxID=225324 RepID=A0A1T4KIX5_9HYPH|nr:hypothetical protein [Enhydrobacter aerosaccus]SJZ42337.1 hypothetical protein SAMN02745126_00998 [Enhydrobacter aerosaccus]
MNTEVTIGPAEFEQALGIAPGTLDARTTELLHSAKLTYARIDAAGQSALEAETMQRIDEGFTVVGEHRKEIWRDAWQEQLERFEASGYDLTALNPKFVDGSTILRWQGQYVLSLSNQFELRVMEILRDVLFRTYLSDVDRFFEFGSGSAFNVAAYAKLFPEVPACALDWAPAAVRIAELLRERLGMKVRGERFDFFAPSKDLVLGPGAGVFTMCALEQTGDRFGAFLDYLLQQRPRRVVHVEPTVELYDPTTRHDQLAIEYHTRRKYLVGLLPALKKLAADDRINLVYSRRLRFGSRFHECFSIHVWEPKE